MTSSILNLAVPGSPRKDSTGVGSRAPCTLLTEASALTGTSTTVQTPATCTTGLRSNHIAKHPMVKHSTSTLNRDLRSFFAILEPPLRIPAYFFTPSCREQRAHQLHKGVKTRGEDTADVGGCQKIDHRLGDGIKMVRGVRQYQRDQSIDVTGQTLAINDLSRRKSSKSSLHANYIRVHGGSANL